jgi:iron complex outermembrane receptor protein
VRSEFTAGSFDGEPVPLVAPWTLSGGATWEAADWLWIAGSVTWIDESRRGSDYQGDSPDIPDRTQVAARVGGSIDRLRWSAAVQHWLDDTPYDTGFYSSFSGAYNAYPYAPTTLSASVGMTF